MLCRHDVTLFAFNDCLNRFSRAIITTQSLYPWSEVAALSCWLRTTSNWSQSVSNADVFSCNAYYVTEGTRVRAFFFLEVLFMNSLLFWKKWSETHSDFKSKQHMLCVCVIKSASLHFVNTAKDSHTFYSDISMSFLLIACVWFSFTLHMLKFSEAVIGLDDCLFNFVRRLNTFIPFRQVITTRTSMFASRVTQVVRKRSKESSSFNCLPTTPNWCNAKPLCLLSECHPATLKTNKYSSACFLQIYYLTCHCAI